MTREEFEARFQILNQIADGPVRSFHALASTGAVVMAHFLEGAAAEPDGSVRSALDELEPERRERVLKVVEVDGEPVVVTKFILDFESLERWLGLAPPANEPVDGVSGAATEAASEPEPGPGEFTRIFGAGGTAAAAATPPTSDPGPDADPEPADEPGAAADGPAGQPAGAAPRSDEPGEFTRLFQAPEPEPTGPAGPDEAGTTSQAEPAARAGGAAEPPNRAEDRDSAAGAAPADPAPSKPSVEPDGPGEFTRLFQAPAAAPDESPAPEPTAPPEPPRTREPGEFTRAFAARPPERSAPERSAPERSTPERDAEAEPDLRMPRSEGVELPPASPSLPRLRLERPDAAHPARSPEPSLEPNRPTPESGEFTRIFGQAGSPPPQSVPGSGTGTGGAPPPASVGGEYTRIVAAAGPPPAEPPQAVAPRAAPPSEPALATPSNALLIGGLVAVLLVALVLIVIVVIRAA